MFKPSPACLAAGLSLLCSAPALSQAQDDEPARELEGQVNQAIQQLFEDFELDADAVAGDEVDERLLAEQRRLEQVQQRILRLQRARVVELVPDAFEGEPVNLDAKPLVNPFEGKPREAVVAALSHEDFALRESAEALLLTDETLGHAALQALIKQSDSPEQRQRLLRLAEHHALREWRERDFSPADVAPNHVPGFVPRRSPASIGYSYEPVVANENPYLHCAGVRVIATMPGFPGHAHLRQGDIIVQIGGMGMSPGRQEHEITDWVRRRIKTHAAGDTMSLSVLRGGELLAIELVCAEGAALDLMYTTDAFETAARKEPYKRAWRDARDEMLQSFPRPKVLTPVELGADE